MSTATAPAPEPTSSELIAQAFALWRDGHAIRISNVFDDKGRLERVIIEHYLSCVQCGKEKR